MSVFKNKETFVLLWDLTHKAGLLTNDLKFDLIFSSLWNKNQPFKREGTDGHLMDHHFFILSFG